MSVGIIQPEATYRLSLKQYHRMIEEGILGEDDPVELLEGRLVTKMPRGPLHDATISILGKQVDRKLPEEWFLRIQSAVTLRSSEPEPDLAIVLGPIEKYLHKHPGAADIGCLMEVAESSLEFDQLTKGPVYAAARIPHYWIVNLVERAVEVYSDPRGSKNAYYDTCRVYQRSDKVPLVLHGETITLLSVSKILVD